ncbi:TPA: hypothetical protein DCZ39_07170 [Patescibacteria group bacterium]|nr:hypothetical protein [Candidatus Gracilibacteria bacterium]
MYLPYILSKPGEAGLKLINQGATYTNEHGSAGIDKVKEVTGQGYDEAKKLVGKATGEETNYLFQGLTKATEEATSLVGKTVSASGQRIYDSYDTEQRR